jgi:hypothetical protein
VAIISGLSRSVVGAGLRWETVPAPEEIGVDKRERHVRYVTLNPCRARLVCDPLAWPWSTHRDIVGAVIEPWVTAEALAAALGRPAPRFAPRHHAYVSADPTASVVGTPYPQPAGPSALPVYPLGAIAVAAAAAHRGEVADVRKRSRVRATFIDLARECGWRDATLVAQAAALTPTAVRWRWRMGRPAHPAAWLCLGDVRLAPNAPPPARPIAESSPREARSMMTWPLALGSSFFGTQVR